MLELELRHKFTNSKQESFCLDVAFSLKKGEILALYGASGAGKSTILRAIAGLISSLKCADSGFIKFDGKVWLDAKKRIFVPPQRRNVGFLFQDYGLFPHLSVWKNVLFGDSTATDFATELMEIMDISGLKSRSIREISGGQAQRVALARALLRRPKLLLLDEPLSALDLELRSRLQNLLLRLRDELSLTIIIVSHDKNEILRLCNSVAHIKDGRCINLAPTLKFFPPKPLTAKVIACTPCEDSYTLKILLNGEIYEIKSATAQEVGKVIQISNI